MMTTKEVDENSDYASSDGIPVAVAVAISDTDEEAEALALASREESIANIRQHCESHLSSNPTSTYVSWIATLHPENAHVTIDSRFMIPINPWLTVWHEAKDELQMRSENNTVTPTAPPDPTPTTTTFIQDQDDKQQHARRTCEGSILDFIVGNVLVLVSMAVSFAFELAASYCYISYWICMKVVNMCSPPNIITLLPFFIAFLIGACFQLIDMLLLFVGIVFVESVAIVNYIVVTILALSHRRGRKMHQLTRRLPHLTRWAFRHTYFKKWDPPRSTFCVCEFDQQRNERG